MNFLQKNEYIHMLWIFKVQIILGIQRRHPSSIFIGFLSNGVFHEGLERLLLLWNVWKVGIELLTSQQLKKKVSPHLTAKT